MAYDDSLAARVRDGLARERDIVEKKLFGGLGFLLNGNLLVCVWKDALIVRLGPEQAEDAMLEPHVRPFDVTGRPMKAWVMVDSDGVEDDDSLAVWIERAIGFVKSLPGK